MIAIAHRARPGTGRWPFRQHDANACDSEKWELVCLICSIFFHCSFGIPTA